MGKFCILQFVRVIEPFVGKNAFVPEIFYAFNNESRLVAPVRKFIIPNNRISLILNEMIWFVFLMTEGSMSRSLTRMGSKFD